MRLCACLLVSITCLGAAAELRYRAAIERWHRKQDQELTAPDGPLALVARFVLKPGSSLVGKSPASDCVLPVPSAPARVGVADVSADRVVLRVEPAIVATIGGRRVTSVEYRAAPPVARGPRVAIGTLILEVRWIRGEPHLIARDSRSQLLRNAHPLRWFPVQERYRVAAEFVPFPKRVKMSVPDSDGLSRIWDSPGTARFRLDGEAVSLQAFQAGNTLVFVFRDATSGKESYGAGRILETDVPKNDKVVLDFNRATNPLCAYNPLSICPRPVKQNVLTVRIPAGEMKYSNH